jgi:hypothetical protein
MTRESVLFGTLAAAILLLIGCGANQQQQRQAEAVNAGTAADEEQEFQGVEFKEGRGLSIPARMCQTLDLKFVDVDEGKATRRIELPLRVFKTELGNGEGHVLASGNLETNLAAFLVPGTKVSVEATGASSNPGTVVKVEFATAKLAGLAEVIVRFPSSNETRVGTFMEGQVTITNAEDVVIIPKEALLKTAEGYFAYVVNGDRIIRAKIGIGGQDGHVAEVTEGLYFGDRVALRPIMALWLAELQAIRGGKACADGH